MGGRGVRETLVHVKTKKWAVFQRFAPAFLVIGVSSMQGCGVFLLAKATGRKPAFVYSQASREEMPV